MESKKRVKRFSPLQRFFHLVLLATFLVQGTTGLARMYIETPWGQRLAWIFGGYDACRTVHIYGGIFLILLFLAHIVYLMSTIDWKNFPSHVSGPDSLLPRFQDIKQFFQHVGWFLGMCKPPAFERWGYWEKFDYWAVFWGIPVLGITGLLLAFPIAASRIMPGWGLNVAFWVHRIEALLAMCHVFVIHFFVAHLRRVNFPMDRAMFEGSADLENTRHERAVWIARLKEEGKLEKHLVPETSAAARVVFYVVGWTAMAIGWFLLIGGLVNSTRITW